jgi:hypothetical protein
MPAKPYIRLKLVDGSTEFIDADGNETRAAAQLNLTFERIANGDYEGAFVRVRGDSYVNVALILEMEPRGF